MKWKNILIGIATIPFLPLILIFMLLNELGNDVLESIKRAKK